MKFEEFGTENEKTMMLLPGTCCDWQTNFGNVPVLKAIDEFMAMPV